MSVWKKKAAFDIISSMQIGLIGMLIMEILLLISLIRNKIKLVFAPHIINSCVTHLIFMPYIE